MAVRNRPNRHMPQGQFALGRENICQATLWLMMKRADDGLIDPIDSEFFRVAGQRLRAVRKIAGINQTVMAARMGVDQSTWSKWETGKRIPNPAKIARFATRAKTSLDFIYRGQPIGTHPILLKLLRASVPALVAEEPNDTDQSTDTALTSYRNSIQQAMADPE